MKKKKKRKFFSRTKLFALFVLMVPPDPPGKGWISSHPSRPQRLCQKPSRASPCPSIADYSPHCVLKTRACNGKGAFLSSHSGHKPFCEPTLFSCSHSVTFRRCSEPFQVRACKVSLFQKCWPITIGIQI